jgi:hypothetical protein
VNARMLVNEHALKTHGVHVSRSVFLFDTFVPPLGGLKTFAGLERTELPTFIDDLASGH